MKRPLPSGTVTLVFTDIAGSTALLRELGDRYAAMLADHRRIIREIVDRRGGVEVDTQGDAFFLAFARASDAVAAAREIVDGLADAGPVKVRIGIHTGEPMVTDEGFVGMDVHIAARVAASGHGGQVLASRQTIDLAGATDVRDLGAHRLPDVGELQLFQVGGGDFPAVRSIGRTTVSPPRLPLLGRDRQVAELRTAISDDDARLITVTGPGGIGKTTLARAVASGLGAAFPDGSWFVDLSSITDPDLVEPAVASAIGIHGGVADHLRSRAALLVLDNFEQVMAAATLVDGWLDACRRLVVVVTSREALRLHVEREVPLDPLDEASAVELFRERARAVVPRFEAETADLRRLCRRLDGIPLALELAAARMRLLSPEQLLERLDHRLAILTGGRRDLPPRQRTLQATIAWSHDLLEAGERELFADLAVFTGGWTLDAAEMVCHAGLETLESLVAKSLVRVDDSRFSMLETIREFAVARLAERPDVDELRRRHARWFAELASAAEPQLTGAEQERWLHVLAAEDENIRAALEWSLGDPASHGTALRLGSALVIFWYLRGRPAEGWRWLEAILALAIDDAPVSLRAAWGAGFFLSMLGDPRAGSILEDASRAARRLDDMTMLARTLDLLGLVALFEDRPLRGRDLLMESVEVARRVGDDWTLADAFGTLGSIQPLLGDIHGGRASSIQGLRVARARDDLQGTRMALFGLALTEWRAGNVAAARMAAEEGLAICRRLGDTFFSAYFLWLLGHASLTAGEADTARAQAEESLELAREVGAPVVLSCALEISAAVARSAGDQASARVLLDEADRLGRAGGVPGAYRSEVLRALADLDVAQGDLDAGRTRLVEAVKVARSVSDPWAEGRAARDLAAL